MGITITRHFFDFDPEDCSEILRLRRMDQGEDLRVIHIVGSREHFAGVDPGLDLLLLEVLDERLDPELTHTEGILEDDPLEFPLLQGFDQGLARIESHELDNLLPREVRTLSWPHPLNRSTASSRQGHQDKGQQTVRGATVIHEVSPRWIHRLK